MLPYINIMKNTLSNKFATIKSVNALLAKVGATLVPSEGGEEMGVGIAGQRLDRLVFITIDKVIRSEKPYTLESSPRSGWTVTA